MICIPALPQTCLGDAGGAIGEGISSILGNSFAEAMKDGASWVIKTTVGWWIQVPAIDLANSPADTIRGYVQWLALVVAVVGVTWQGLLMAVSRRADPLLNIGRGLFYLALWSSVGIIGPAAALKAGDSFSTWVLDRAAGGQAATRLVQLASLDSVTSPGAVILLGLLVMLAGLVQAVLMIFREGAVVILAGVVLLAAAGSFTQATRPWLPRVLGWMLALIAYKPAAALVYAAALAMVGQQQDARTVFMGLTMMLLALVALPVLMKFFTWTTGAASGGGGGGLAAVAAGSAAAIHARAAFGSAPGGAAASQASAIRQDLGPQGGAPASGAAAAPQTAASPVPPAGGAASTSATGAGAAVAGAAPGVGTAVVVAGTVASGAARAATRATGATTEGESR